jgi:plastocyanin
VGRLQLLGITLLALASVLAHASPLAVNVRDRNGMPVKDVVVIARSLNTNDKAIEDPQPAVMDQMNRQFAPFVIAVRAGTSVLFANSDSVAHQVYSFSQARPFELGLYRGKPRSPIVFDKPGVVVLGCNIHDNMVGYVYVTDAAHFGTTDATGQWRSRDLSAGEYSVEIWTPRASPHETALKKVVTFSQNPSTPVEFRFENPLGPAPVAVREQRLRDY